MNFDQLLNDMQVKYSDHAKSFREDLFRQAFALLRADIENPQLTNLRDNPDAFMLRANQIGLALFNNGFFSLAEQLYERLAEETLKYCSETGNCRHTGALYANAGGACVRQGNFERAIVYLLKASRDDEVTYKIPPEKSFAITNLFEEYIAEPTRNNVMMIAQQINISIKLEDIKALRKTLGSNENAFLSYASIALTHEDTNMEFSNDFSHMQIFTALRNLSALLEVVLKKYNGNANDEFFPTLKDLFSKKRWWEDFKRARREVGASKETRKPVDFQLEESIKITATDDNSIFWKSLLIAYITRNYTVHQMDYLNPSTQKNMREMLGHIFNVMITAKDFI